MHPAQVLSSLPQAVSTLLDPADCGPVFIGLPQDIAADGVRLSRGVLRPVQVHEIARPRPDLGQIVRAADAIRAAERPVIIAGGGVHYSRAESELAAFAEEFGIPVVETVAGKSCLLADHPRYAGPVGVTGAGAANVVVTEADLVIAIGTRLEDFTTGSWTVFDPSARFVGVNAARFDAIKHRVDPRRRRRARVDRRPRPTLFAAGRPTRSGPSAGWRCASSCRPSWTAAPPTTAYGRRATRSWSGLVHESATEDDYVMTAAGGLPGELNINWMSKAIASLRLRLRVLVHGLRDRGRLGRGLRCGRPGRCTRMVGDGSYLMMNSEIYCVGALRAGSSSSSSATTRATP